MNAAQATADTIRTCTAHDGLHVAADWALIDTDGDIYDRYTTEADALAAAATGDEVEFLRDPCPCGDEA